MVSACLQSPIITSSKKFFHSLNTRKTPSSMKAAPTRMSFIMRVLRTQGLTLGERVQWLMRRMWWCSTEKNFSDFIATNRYVMVEFYASWCYWSRKLEPEYSAAATLLKGEAVLAKVEAAVEKGLARKYEIQGILLYFLFAGGIHKDSYYGERTRDAIATWMRQKTGLAVPTVSTTAQAKWILRTNYVIVMGFLDTGSDTKELDAAFKLHAGINFYKTDNADVARLFRIDPQIKPPALVMLKWEAANLSHIGFDGQFTKSEISDFVSTNTFQSTKPEISDSVSTNNAPSVITFTVDDASRILGNPMKQLWLFSTNHSLELISTFEEAAKAFRDKLVFVYAETDGTDFGLGADLAFQFDCLKVHQELWLAWLMATRIYITVK
ncbi:DISULFIDE ISOMERASE putative-RELATED [Salix koriyanagi]|uniref:DISULFIDE ISOMERASE putative-RELATED n=1 Tax=Salix koriyanagi TaxID=2511006 RepID=A0A9Q0WII9_9ROSI|nr:DISULFIDE ISOMERASE putative-RELATED [Salix koriyanagi]